MAHIEESKSHSIGKDAAKQVAEKIAGDLTDRIGVTYRWRGDDLVFERSGAKGSIQVSDTEVRVLVELGLMLRPLRGKIQGMVRNYLEESLS